MSDRDDRAADILADQESSTCPTCGGRGEFATFIGYDSEYCPDCGGSGYRWVCPVCRGTRTIQPDPYTPAEPCPRCVDPDEGA